MNVKVIKMYRLLYFQNIIESLDILLALRSIRYTNLILHDNACWLFYLGPTVNLDTFSRNSTYKLCS